MNIAQDKQNFFIEKLLEWSKMNPRELPWVGSKDAYKVWLSEILLQQTRVEQGLPYYERFVEAYPTIIDLAQAPEDEVFKLWQGLGYYARARNLHQTAKYIAEAYQGIFPNTYDAIRALKGVGDYTAAAIASFAFNLPYAVVDGNVYRVLARFFGIANAIDSSEGKKIFSALAQQLLDTEQPARYNQAIMDFGAGHCKPQNPLCGSCLHREQCVAFQQNKVSELPYKSKKLSKKDRFFYYFVYQFGDTVWVKKRAAKDVWQDLYDFPLWELPQYQDWQSLQQNAELAAWLPLNALTIGISGIYKQTLSHQKIVATFVEIQLTSDFESKNPAWQPIPIQDFKQLAVPKIIEDYWNNRTQAQKTLF